MKITDDMLTEWRKEFEAIQRPRVDLSKEARGGRYKNPVVQACWDTWQAARRTTPDRDCEWSVNDFDNGIWESACGETWSFVDGGPIENRMLFCHRCGGILKITPADASREES